VLSRNYSPKCRRTPTQKPPDFPSNHPPKPYLACKIFNCVREPKSHNVAPSNDALLLSHCAIWRKLNCSIVFKLITHTNANLCLVRVDNCRECRAATIDIQIASLVIADEEVPTLSNSKSSYKTFLFNPKLCLQRVS